ncbi:type II toxin-antitoxin system ParD family antitoxin [Thiobacillus sp.]|uniref:type II toxin-antitoxin system ParD family antitoxin n=1 Tax=Thiobacillus sp. TaxID=924 RepID=UPI0025FD711E|nr:type II toxin-antitoxin system ParD family antitoxin [Thiobacillus sp.]
MNHSMPETSLACVDEQALQRGCGSNSEYERELIRDQARQHLRGLLLEGAASAPAGPADQSYFEGLRRRAA